MIVCNNINYSKIYLINTTFRQYQFWKVYYLLFQILLCNDYVEGLLFLFILLFLLFTLLSSLPLFLFLLTIIIIILLDYFILYSPPTMIIIIIPILRFLVTFHLFLVQFGFIFFPGVFYQLLILELIWYRWQIFLQILVFQVQLFIFMLWYCL